MVTLRLSMGRLSLTSVRVTGVVRGIAGGELGRGRGWRRRRAGSGRRGFVQDPLGAADLDAWTGVNVTDADVGWHVRPPCTSDGHLRRSGRCTTSSQAGWQLETLTPWPAKRGSLPTTEASIAAVAGAQVPVDLDAHRAAAVVWVQLA